MVDVAPISTSDGRVMKTYVILRRHGWRTAEDLEEAAARSTVEGDRRPDDVRWIRSYVLSETDGSLARSASTRRRARRRSGATQPPPTLPVDEIVEVADTVLVREDPIPAHS